MSPSTPNEIREALASTARTLDPHQMIAVRLVLDYNHGRIVEEPAWLDAFVSTSGAGHAYIRWDRLTLALDGDPVVAEEVRDAVRPYPDTERSIMRVAADMGSDRWQTARFDANTRAQVAAAVTAALLGPGHSRGGGVSNYIGGANTGSVIQAGTIHGGLSFP